MNEKDEIMASDGIKIENAAKRAYYANMRGELPNGRLPPIWENASDAVRDYMRNMVRKVLFGNSRDEIAPWNR